MNRNGRRPCAVGTELAQARGRWIGDGRRSILARRCLVPDRGWNRAAPDRTGPETEDMPMNARRIFIVAAAALSAAVALGCARKSNGDLLPGAVYAAKVVEVYQ